MGVDGAKEKRPPCVKGAVSREADWGIDLMPDNPSVAYGDTSPYTGEAYIVPHR